MKIFLSGGLLLLLAGALAMLFDSNLSSHADSEQNLHDNKKTHFAEKPVVDAVNNVQLLGNAPDSNLTPKNAQISDARAITKSDERINVDYSIDFSSEAGRARIKKSLVNAMNMLDPVAKAAAAQKIWQDPVETLSIIEAVITQAYKWDENIKVQVQTRVLAMNMLSLYEDLAYADCKRILDVLMNQHAHTREQKHSKVILWDIIGISRLCSFIDADAMEEDIQTLEYHSIRAYIEASIAYARQYS